MIDHFGSIDALINNAGVLVSGTLPTTDLQEQLALVDVNCKGVLIGCHKRLIWRSTNGKIVNVSSASAIYGQPEVSVSASKFLSVDLPKG